MNTSTQAVMLNGSGFTPKHACGVIHIAIQQPIIFDAEKFFRDLQARKKVRYNMDVHDVLHREITIFPFTRVAMEVYLVTNGKEKVSDDEMRRLLTQQRQLTKEDATTFLVSEFGNSFKFAPNFSPTHQSVLYLDDGTALIITRNEMRKLWDIARCRRSFGIWHLGDTFFGRQDGIELGTLAA